MSKIIMLLDDFLKYGISNDIYRVIAMSQAGGSSWIQLDCVWNIDWIISLIIPVTSEEKTIILNNKDKYSKIEGWVDDLDAPTTKNEYIWKKAEEGKVLVFRLDKDI